MRPLAVFDLDGTLADTRHRLHHLERRPADWDAFFAAARDDPPLPDRPRAAARERPGLRRRLRHRPPGALPGRHPRLAARARAAGGRAARCAAPATAARRGWRRSRCCAGWPGTGRSRWSSTTTSRSATRTRASRLAGPARHVAGSRAGARAGAGGRGAHLSRAGPAPARRALRPAATRAAQDQAAARPGRNGTDPVGRPPSARSARAPPRRDTGGIQPTLTQEHAMCRHVPPARRATLPTRRRGRSPAGRSRGGACSATASSCSTTPVRCCPTAARSRRTARPYRLQPAA